MSVSIFKFIFEAERSIQNVYGLNYYLLKHKIFPIFVFLFISNTEVVTIRIYTFCDIKGLTALFKRKLLFVFSIYYDIS